MPPVRALGAAPTAPGAVHSGRRGRTVVAATPWGAAGAGCRARTPRTARAHQGRGQHRRARSVAGATTPVPTTGPVSSGCRARAPRLAGGARAGAARVAGGWGREPASLSRLRAPPRSRVKHLAPWTYLAESVAALAGSARAARARARAVEARAMDHAPWGTAGTGAARLRRGRRAHAGSRGRAPAAGGPCRPRREPAGPRAVGRRGSTRAPRPRAMGRRSAPIAARGHAHRTTRGVVPARRRGAVPTAPASRRQGRRLLCGRKKPNRQLL